MAYIRSKYTLYFHHQTHMHNGSNRYEPRILEYDAPSSADDKNMGDATNKRKIGTDR